MEEEQAKKRFKFMKNWFKIRDILLPRERILKEVGIKEGMSVVEFGCGTGSYTLPLSRMLGSRGVLYAIDKNDISIETTKDRLDRAHAENVRLIKTDCSIDLPDASIDIVLLYDVFHMLEEPDKVLKELHRLLKPAGILSFNDHHMKDDEIVSGVTSSGLFRFVKKERYSHRFERV
jgi:ubiquinone/menaquinone biosynthesis C-methylase UbiE